MPATIMLESKVHAIESGAQVVVTKPSDHHVLWLRPRSTERPGAPYVVAPPDPFVPWSVQRIYYSVNDQVAFADGMAGDARDQASALAHARGTDGRVYATVAWGASAEDLVILIWRPAHAMVPFISSGVSGSPYDKIEAQMPGFMAHAGRRLKAKATLLTKMNPMDALAEQEKQIDLLSKIVVGLVLQLVPAGDRPAWFARFRDVVQDNDSTLSKGIVASLDDIEAQKQRRAAAVAAYLTAQEGA